MKTHLLTGVLFFVLATVASAASTSPIQPSALSVRVVQENTERTATNWKTDWGSASKDYLRRRVLCVTLRAVGEYDPRVTLEWYFIGKSNDGGGGLAVYGAGAAEASVSRVATKPYVIGSDFVTHYQDRYNALGITERGGLKPFGWVVLVWQGDRLLRSEGSTPELARDYSAALRSVGPPKIKK